MGCPIRQVVQKMLVNHCHRYRIQSRSHFILVFYIDPELQAYTKIFKVFLAFCVYIGVDMMEIGLN